MLSAARKSFCSTQHLSMHILYYLQQFTAVYCSSLQGSLWYPDLCIHWSPKPRRWNNPEWTQWTSVFIGNRLRGPPLYHIYTGRAQKAVTSDKGKRGHHPKMAKLRIQTRTPDLLEGTHCCRSALQESILGTDEVNNEMMPVGSCKETFPNHPYWTILR